MERSQPAVLRITSPGEAAQLIPYLVGFTPEESLVVSAIQAGRVEVTARVDLADVRDTDRVEELLDRIWDRFPDADGFAVAYTADHDLGWQVLARCDGWLPDGCSTMLVDADTWHTPDGASGTIDTFGAVAAEATYHGLQRLERRAELETRFTSPPDSAELDRQLESVLTSLPEPGEKQRILDTIGELLARSLPQTANPPRDAQLETGWTLDPTDAIRLSVLVQHAAARDLALLSITRDNATRHLALWQGVVQASPAYGADMPLYLAGMAAWVSGDGASATIALERALRSVPHPDQSHPARLLEALIDRVVPPASWTSIRRAIAADVDPAIRDALGADAPNPRPRWAPITSPLGAPRPELEERRPPAPGVDI